jgi:hypothetical protein
MLLKLLLDHQTEWKEGRIRKLLELNWSPTITRLENPGNKSNIFNMVDPLWYCGGATELD